MKKVLSLMMMLMFALGAWAETTTLSNADIVAAGDAGTGYTNWDLTDGNGNQLWEAPPHKHGTNALQYRCRA